MSADTLWRQQAIVMALRWLKEAREAAFAGSSPETIGRRITYAEEHICNALDIRPSDAAIEALVEAQQENANA